MYKFAYLYAFIGTLLINSTVTFVNAYLNTELQIDDVIICVSMSVLIFTRGLISRYIGNKLSPNNIFQFVFVFFLMFSFTAFLYCSASMTESLFLARIAHGIATGVFWVSSMTLVSYLVPLGKKIKGVSSYYFINNLAAIIIVLVSGILIAKYSPPFAFKISGTISIILALLFGIIILRYSHKLKIEKIEKEDKKFKYSFKKLALEQKIAVTTVIVSYAINAFIYTYAGIFVIEQGGTYREVGYLVAFYLTANILANYLAPTLHRRIPPLVLTLSPLIILIGLLCLFSLKHTLAWLFIIIPLITGVYSLSSTVWQSITQEYAAQNNQGKIIGFTRGTGDLISFSYYLIMAWIVSHISPYYGGYILAFIIFCNLLFLLYNRKVIKSAFARTSQKRMGDARPL